MAEFIILARPRATSRKDDIQVATSSKRQLMCLHVKLDSLFRRYVPTRMSSNQIELEKVRFELSVAHQSQRRLAAEENEDARQLLRCRLDALELSTDGASLQLPEWQRVEEMLKRQLNQARVDSERAQLELKAAHSEVDQLGLRMSQQGTEIGKVSGMNYLGMKGFCKKAYLNHIDVHTVV